MYSSVTKHLYLVYSESFLMTHGAPNRNLTTLTSLAKGPFGCTPVVMAGRALLGAEIFPHPKFIPKPVLFRLCLQSPPKQMLVGSSTKGYIHTMTLTIAWTFVHSEIFSPHHELLPRDGRSSYQLMMMNKG